MFDKWDDSTIPKKYFSPRNIKQSLDEMANIYPEGFDFNVMTSFPKFYKRMEYAEKFFVNDLGEGSSRRTYAIASDTGRGYENVLKIARNPPGIAQNSAEIEAWRAYSLLCCAPVTNHSEQNIFLEMQFAKPIGEMTALIDWLGIPDNKPTYPGELFYEAGRRKIKKLLKSLNPEPPHLELSLEWIDSIDTLMNELETLEGDLRSEEHWGWVEKNGERVPVVIDYGYNQEVNEAYYRIRNGFGAEERTDELPLRRAKVKKYDVVNDFSRIIKYEDVKTGLKEDPDDKTPALQKWMWGEEEEEFVYVEKHYRNGNIWGDFANTGKPATISIYGSKVNDEEVPEGSLYFEYYNGNDFKGRETFTPDEQTPNQRDWVQMKMQGIEPKSTRVQNTLGFGS